MPEFALIPLTEAKMLTAIDRQQRIMNEFYPWIREVQNHPDEAGRIRAVGDEDPQRIRNQLASVAKALGVALTIRRRNEFVCFWFEPEPPPTSPSRRGRRQPDTATGAQQDTSRDELEV
jgi:hypothetical protein